MTAVLVVDDDRDAAEDYARLIRQLTGLAVSAVDDPNSAARIVGDGGVAVVVLDQQMPQASGTELFLRLRALDSRVRGILLTGEATSEEVGTALNQGFSRYIHKSQALSSLADAVRHEFIEYQNALLLEVSAKQPVLVKKRRGWLLGSSVVVRFMRFEIVDDGLVRDNDWREVLTLQAGQQHRVKLAHGEAWTLQLEDESTAKIGSAFGLEASQVAKVTSSLQSEVVSRFKESMTTTASLQIETEQTFRLPDEPADVNALHVRVRRIQQAPVLVKTRLELMQECGCCGRPSLLTVQALFNTGALALRHIDFLSDETQRVVDLGRAGSS